MKPSIRELRIPGVYEVIPERFGDERGFFSETFNSRSYAQIGINVEWVQDNHSLSTEAGVLRGLHYQLPPHAQCKLVRVPRGRIYDVVADIRKQSATYGQWLGIELSAEKWNQLFVPKGFAHGFLTLEANTELSYKVSDFYNAESDRSIKFDDLALSVDWPLNGQQPILSNKDQQAVSLQDADLPDTWDD